jgi:hypothetical protein
MAARYRVRQVRLRHTGSAMVFIELQSDKMSRAYLLSGR